MVNFDLLIKSQFSTRPHSSTVSIVSTLYTSKGKKLSIASIVSTQFHPGCTSDAPGKATQSLKAHQFQICKYIMFLRTLLIQ